MVHAAWAKNTIFSLALVGICQGQEIVNVHHFEATALNEATFLTDGLAQASGLLLAADWVTNLVTSYRAMLANDYSLQKVTAQVMERPGLTSHKLLATDYTTGLPLAGTLAAAADDMTTVVDLKWRSVLAGKHHRGRTYVGPISDVISAAGLVSNLTPYQTYAAAMITRYTGGGAGVVAGWTFTVYSRPYNAPAGAYTKRIGGLLTVVNAGTDYNGDSTFITAGSVDPVLRTQRRREIGKGA